MSLLPVRPLRLIGAAASGLAMLASPAAASADELQIAGTLADHAVIQSGQPLVISGTAPAASRIVVTLGKQRSTAQADAAGHWRVILPPQRPGKMPMLQVKSGRNTITVRDMLAGDLFLCSGQSNMEFKVAQASTAAAELARPAQPLLRLLHIDHASAPTPQSVLPGHTGWSVAGPTTLKDFSAVCAFFGRAVQKERKVPVGLIDASWGGSNIEAWVPAAALAKAGDYADDLALNRQYASDPASAVNALTARWERWWRKTAPADGQPWLGDGTWQPVPHPLRNWKEWGEDALKAYDGVVFFRTAVELTAAQAEQVARLDTGQIDEEDQTWFNGQGIGNSFGWAEPRSYDVPTGSARPGRNEIVIAVYSSWDKGGMFGPEDGIALRFKDGSTLPLKDWQWQKPSGNPGGPPHAPWHSIGGLTGMYNAMIHPLGEARPRAILWYQGESNTGNAPAYAGQLDALRRGWREQFGSDIPFLVVQLPQFGARSSVPSESGWAALRDAQRRAVAADARSALAVTIDTGDPANLHPTDKQAVADRLDTAARGLLYGGNQAPSGPLPARAVRSGETVAIEFTGVTGALITNGKSPGPFELCAAGAGTCQTVPARIERGTVTLAIPAGMQPVRVRYCWGDAPVCSLFDGSDRPASPFELPVP